MNAQSMKFMESTGNRGGICHGFRAGIGTVGIAILTASLLLTASLAAAVTYKWEDRRGVHFSDDFNSVPHELRTRAVPEDEDGVINFGRIAPSQRGTGVRQKDLHELERVDAERDRIVMEGIKQYQDEMIRQTYQQSSDLQGHVVRFFAQRAVFWIAPLFLFLYAWLLTVIDIVRSNFTVPAQKYRWLAAVLLFAPLGIPVYYLRGRSRKAGATTAPGRERAGTAEGGSHRHAE